MIFFCIFSTSSLSAIFIMTLRLLRSVNDSSLRRCSFIDNSSLVMFVHDMIFDEKRVFLCICNCLLSSWTDVFSFYTFFVMNASWITWCFSSDLSWKWCISFSAISFHEWSLLIFFSNIDVFISKLIMLVIFSSLLCKRCDLTSLFSCDMSTLLAIFFELALLQLVQFIVVWSFFKFTLSCI